MLKARALDIVDNAALTAVCNWAALLNGLNQWPRWSSSQHLGSYVLRFVEGVDPALLANGVAMAVTIFFESVAILQTTVN